jgi:hypothetical protein
VKHGVFEALGNSYRKFLDWLKAPLVPITVCRFNRDRLRRMAARARLSPGAEDVVYRAAIEQALNRVKGDCTIRTQFFHHDVQVEERMSKDWNRLFHEDTRWLLEFNASLDRLLDEIEAGGGLKVFIRQAYKEENGTHVSDDPILVTQTG